MITACVRDQRYHFDTMPSIELLSVGKRYHPDEGFSKSNVKYGAQSVRANII